jgi:hypothetical protein
LPFDEVAQERRLQTLLSLVADQETEMTQFCEASTRDICRPNLAEER